MCDELQHHHKQVGCEHNNMQFTKHDTNDDVMSSMYMCVSPWVHSLLRFVLHHLLPLLPSHALRAAHWVRQFDRYAKLAHLREQQEQRRLRRLRLPHKISTPTVACLTRAKKVRYLKRTRELNLYLTILALKSNDLNKIWTRLETHHGIFWRWLGRWPSDEVKHILHSVLRWSISLDEWMWRTGDCCLVQWRIRNVCSGCTVSWVDFRTSHTGKDWTIIPDTRENRQLHSTRSGNETRSKSKRDCFSFKIWYFGNFYRCHQSRPMWIRVTLERKCWDVRDSTNWDQCLEWVLRWARRVHLANGAVATSDFGNLWTRVW